MKTYEPGDWLDDSDAPEEDKAEYRRLMAGDKGGPEYSDPEQDSEESNGGAAGCVFGVAMIAVCLFLAWALTQVGGAW